jgi:dephospho-CoA kinase
VSEFPYKQVEALEVYLIGPPGVGKTALGGYLSGGPVELVDESLREEGLREIQTIRMRQLLQWHGYNGPTGLREMSEYHAEQRRNGQAEAIFEPLRRLRNSLVIVDALHHEADIDYCRGNGFIIALHADRNIRHERFMNDNNDEKHRRVLIDLERVGPLDQDQQASFIKRARERAWDLAEEDFFGYDTDGANERRALREAIIEPGTPLRRRSLAGAYLSLADVQIDANGSKDEVTERVLTAIRGFVPVYLERLAA